MSATPPCDNLLIPKRLRTVGRQALQFTDPAELIFRWVKPIVEFPDNGELSAAALGEVFSDAADISCNRSSLCLAATDVLYNSMRLPHRHDHAVVSALITDISSTSFNFSNGGNNWTITFELEHDPEVCMYPHTQVVVLRGGERLSNKVKPPTLRSMIRAELRPLFELCHRANPNLELELERRPGMLRAFWEAWKSLWPFNGLRRSTMSMQSPLCIRSLSHTHLQPG